MRGEMLGFERRWRWSDEEKLKIVMSVGIDAVSVTQVAQRHEIMRQQVYAWHHEMKKKGLWSPDGGALFLPFDIPAHGVPAIADTSTIAAPMAVKLRLRNAQPALRQQHDCGGADAADPSCENGMIGPGTGVCV